MNMTAEHLAEYVEMCWGLDQSAWVPDVGDWTDKGVVAHVEEIKQGGPLLHFCQRIVCWTASEVIHLPRLDQLLRMLPEDGIWKWQALYHADGKWLASAGYGTHGFTGVAPFPESAALQAVEFAKTGRQWKDGRWK